MPLRLLLIPWCLVLTIWGPHSAGAQPPPAPVLERAAVQDELRQSGVDTLHQDRDGFLWIGTREGLVRWDGTTARHWFSIPFDTSSLLHNVVVDIAQDAEGHLWVITRPHIFGPSMASRLVAPAFETFVHYPFRHVTLAMDPEGRPWLAGQRDILRYAPEKDRFETWMQRPTPRSSLGSTALFEDSDLLWILDEGGLDRCRLDTRHCRTFESTLSAPHELRLLDIEGRIRMPSAEDLLCYDDALESMTPCLDLDPLPTAQITSTIHDADGALWFATLEGVWRRTPAGLQKVSIRPGMGNAGNDIYTLLGDHAGGVWAGAPWDFLHWDPYRPPFELIVPTADSTPSRGSAPIISIHQDETKTLWAGTIGDGLYRRKADGAWRHFPESAWTDVPTNAASFVWSISSFGDSVWLGTTYGLVHVDRGTEEITPYPLPEPIRRQEFTTGIRGIVATPSGPLWVLFYYGGLYRFAEGAFEQIYEEPEISLESFVVRRDGKIWLASSEDGLRLVDPEGGDVRVFRHRPSDPRSLAANGTISLHLDDQQTLWVGTSSGLDRQVGDQDHFEHVLGPRELPGSAVLSILEGPERFWLGTNRGLVSIDKEEAKAPLESRQNQRQTVAWWTRHHGVGNLELNRGAATRGVDGTLYFGGDSGLTRFQPRAIRRSEYRPPIRLAKLTLFSGDGTRHLEPRVDQPLEIGPEVTSFTVELATIDFSAPAANLFALQLAGLDPDWIHMGTRRTVTYAGVPPGRYTLRAKVSNGDGVWNDEHLDLPLIVIPPFYRTGWFLATSIGLGVLCLLGLGVLLSRRRYRRRLRKLEIEQQRAEDRRRISQDLHDELGAGLTQIVLLSERESLQPSPGSDALQRIASGARHLIEAIREIIWSIDPEQDRLDRLVPRLRSGVSEMLEAADLRAELEFPEQPPARTISPQLRRNVSLIVREAIHNAVRHADADSVEVGLTHSDAQLSIHIVDDGRGFDIEGATGGHGLDNLRARARAVGGHTEIDSRPGEGTRVQVVLPLDA